MVNKGKGCISAIFNGSIPIALVKHGLDTIFRKPSEPVEPSPIEGYTLLDSIYANGKQYAIIDYYANQNTKVEMKFTYNNNSTYPANLFTSRTSGTSNMFSFLPYEGGSKKTRSAFGTQNIDFTLLTANEEYTVIKDGRYTYIDGELKATHTAQTFTSTNPMYVLMQPSSTATPLEAKIYYMKIWDNGTLVHDLIPALNNTTGIAGLYDMVTKEFITSATDTEFYPVYKTEGLNYVQDGLYANYTGVNYAGNKWIDVANSRNLTLYNSPTYNKELLRYEFGGGSTKQYANGAVNAPSGDFTIEVYGSIPSVSSTSTIPVFFGSIYSYTAGYGLNAVLNSGDIRLGTFITWQNTTSSTNPNTNSKNMYLDGILSADIKTKFVFRRSKSDGAISIFAQNVNGTVTESDTFTTNSITATQLTVGTSKSGSTATSDYRKSNIHAIRIYDRVLTDEEIAQNHTEDVRIYGE